MEENKVDTNIFERNILEIQKQLNELGQISFVPGGISMWPILKHKKQTVIIERLDEGLKRLDVALYHRGGKILVLHRVLEVLPDGYLMRGDSQQETEKVPFDCVLGKMIGYYVGKKFIPCDDKKYLERVEKWLANDKKRQRKLKRFFFFRKVKGKLKRIFGVKSSNKK